VRSLSRGAGSKRCTVGKNLIGELICKGLFTAHELNSTGLQQVDPVTRASASLLDWTGYGETRTVGA